MMTADRIKGGVDLSEITPWKNVERRVNTKNEHPWDRELSSVIRQEGVPVGWPSNYVADRMDGTVKLGRGRGKSTEKDLEYRWARAGALAGQVRYLQAVYRWQRKRSPREAAIKEIARRHNRSRHTLLGWLKDFKRNGPFVVRAWEMTASEANEVVALAVQGVGSSLDCTVTDPATGYPRTPYPVLHLIETGDERVYSFEDALDFVRTEMGV